MNRRVRNEVLLDNLLRLPCGQCGAMSGDPCLSKTGQISPGFHLSRRRAAAGTIPLPDLRLDHWRSVRCPLCDAAPHEDCHLIGTGDRARAPHQLRRKIAEGTAVEPRSVACSRCGALPGQACRTPMGFDVVVAHAVRRLAAKTEHEARR